MPQFNLIHKITWSLLFSQYISSHLSSPLYLIKMKNLIKETNESYSFIPLWGGYGKSHSQNRGARIFITSVFFYAPI